MAKKESYAVIGIGQFGASICEALVQAGQEVLAIDGVENIVVTRQSAHAQFSTGENSSSGVCDMITDGNYSNLEDSLIDGTMPTKGHNVVIAVSVAETEHIEVGSTLELSFGETIISL